jgi:hypothetical protein
MKLHNQEAINGYTLRMAVPGGWLYRWVTQVAYVPDPTAAHVRYAADPWAEARVLAEAAGFKHYGSYRFARGPVMLAVMGDDGLIAWSVSDFDPDTGRRGATIDSGTAPTPGDAMRAALAAAEKVTP